MKDILRRYKPELLYPRPRFSLAPQHLYWWLHTVWQARGLEGALVEVGCYLGGTAALATVMLEGEGVPRRYVCIDTFGGFVREQFEHDADEHGTPSGLSRAFSRSSKAMVARLLRHWGAPSVELVGGDITTLPDAAIPERVAAALIDVDLEIPVYAALERLWPRLVSGGVILVDDCESDYHWSGAKVAYQRFVAEHDLPEHYQFKLGIVTRQGDART